MISYHLSTQSKQRLTTVTTNLKKVIYKAIEKNIIDMAVICGHRPKDDQDAALLEGKTTKPWPTSKHNSFPAKAVDVVPYINGEASFKNLHCCVLAGVILATAKELKIDIRWGGNWDMDGEPITDQTFKDLVHYEEI